MSDEQMQRNTPTCVGKTVSDAELAELLWKHPHVRGEDKMAL